MLPASFMWLNLKHPTIYWLQWTRIVMKIDLACDTIKESWLAHFLRFFSLKLWLETKVTVTPKLYTTPCYPKVCPQTKFWIPMSIGLRRNKTCLRGFRQSDIQTSLLSCRDQLEIWNFALASLDMKKRFFITVFISFAHIILCSPNFTACSPVPLKNGICSPVPLK